MELDNRGPSLGGPELPSWTQQFLLGLAAHVPLIVVELVGHANQCA